MQAFLFSKYNGPLELAETSVPTIGPTELLIKVAAASVNHLDEMLRVGTFKATLPYKLPLTLGNDFSGQVTAVGANVKGFEIGDLVFGKPRQSKIGTFAEYFAVDQSDVALKPQKLSMIEAASVPLVGLTAWQALFEHGNLVAGQKVLIHGGAGGVGSMAIQLAKGVGAIVATTASAANLEVVKELGADIAIDYRSEDFASSLTGFDLVLDTQGGETLIKSLGVLRSGGLAVGITGPPDAGFARSLGLSPLLRFAMTLLSSKVNRLANKLGVKYKFLFVQANGSQLSQIATLIDSGKLIPIQPKVWPFSQTPEALDSLTKGKLGSGKAVIEISGDN